MKTLDSNSPLSNYKRLTVDIPIELHKALKTKAAIEGVTMVEIVHMLLCEKLDIEYVREKS